MRTQLDRTCYWTLDPYLEFDLWNNLYFAIFHTLFDGKDWGSGSGHFLGHYKPGERTDCVRTACYMSYTVWYNSMVGLMVIMFDLNFD